MSASPNAPASSETSELDIKSILLLDDDQDLVDSLKELLESRNFVVTTAKDGITGLQEIIAMDFDVIICDMVMPGMPGEMFYLAVKKTKPYMAERFVFITGHQDNEKIDGFLRSIDALVIFKPALIDELVEMISLVLQRTQQPSSNGEAA